MPESDSIIHSFQQRRQLEEALAALAATTSQAALKEGVQRLVERYDTAALLAAVVRHLGTASSQLRGGLGELCALLPAAEAVAALQAAAGNRSKTPQERTTAALILERYLERPAPPALLADLAGVEEVPYQSLLEAVEEGKRNRHVLLEYVTQMQEHPVDTAFMVQRLIDRLHPRDRAPLLRLIAQDSRAPVAHAAIDRLAAGASEPNGEACLAALHTLVYALPPDMAAIAERQLRKLQFGGKRYTPPLPEGWQALLAPTDASGYTSVWFVHHNGGSDHDAEDSLPGAGSDIHAGTSADPGSTPDSNVWLVFILSIQGGILQFSGSEGMPREHLPVKAPPGELVTVRTTNGKSAVLLTVPFDVGRWLVRQALEARWRQSSPDPLPGEYTLYNDLLWQFAAPKLPPALMNWWERSDPAAAGTVDVSAAAEAALALVDDPAMAGWLRWSTALWHNVKYRSQQPPAVAPATLVSLLLRELVRMPDHRVLLQSMAAGLRVQTLWYATAGSETNAARAALLARATARLPITDNPLVARLLEKGYGA